MNLCKVYDPLLPMLQRLDFVTRTVDHCPRIPKWIAYVSPLCQSILTAA